MYTEKNLLRYLLAKETSDTVCWLASIAAHYFAAMFQLAGPLAALGLSLVNLHEQHMGVHMLNSFMVWSVWLLCHKQHCVLLGFSFSPPPPFCHGPTVVPPWRCSLFLQTGGCMTEVKGFFLELRGLFCYTCAVGASWFQVCWGIWTQDSRMRATKTNVMLWGWWPRNLEERRSISFCRRPQLLNKDKEQHNKAASCEQASVSQRTHFPYFICCFVLQDYPLFYPLKTLSAKISMISSMVFKFLI